MKYLIRFESIKFTPPESDLVSLLLAKMREFWSASKNILKKIGVKISVIISDN